VEHLLKARYPDQEPAERPEAGRQILPRVRMLHLPDNTDALSVVTPPAPPPATMPDIHVSCGSGWTAEPPISIGPETAESSAEPSDWVSTMTVRLVRTV
jgi:hypothetical protein